MYIACATSCPVETAHTYMAAANLEKTAKAKGYEVEVETQGAQDVENEITAEDIGYMDGCIITNSVRIKSSGRFEPVPALTVGVSGAVKNVKAIVEELLKAIS